MMTPKRIQRLIHSGDDDALLDAVLSNGRPLPIEARLRLGEPDSIGAAAAAFGLQRSLELSACTDPVSLEALARLLSTQGRNGEFGNAATTAAAIRALDLLLRSPGLAEADARVSSDALDRALHALHCAIAMPVLAPSRIALDELDRAIVIWQLADRAELRTHLGLDSVERELASPGLRTPAVKTVLGLAGTIAPARRAA